MFVLCLTFSPLCRVSLLTINPFVIRRTCEFLNFNKIDKLFLISMKSFSRTFGCKDYSSLDLT